MYLENRLIAMLDVLGLSSKITSKDQLINTSHKYNKLIREAKEKVFISDYATDTPTPHKASNFEIGEFVFDNLVLVSHPINPSNASCFSLALIRLMHIFAESDMPLRGAISVGDYCHDEESKVFLSNAFKKLSSEEANQNWSGCVVTLEAENIIRENVLRGVDLSQQKKEQAYIKMPIPWKHGSEERLCVNWMHTISDPAKNRLINYLKGDTKKHEGTLKGLEFIKDLPSNSERVGKEWRPVRNIRYVVTCSHITPYFYDKDMKPSVPKNPNVRFVIKAWA